MKEDNGKSVPDPAAPPAPSNSYWTTLRMDLRAWLQRNAPSLAELHEGAVRLLHEIPLPGRVRFISHAVREIRNRLPDAISGPTSGGRFDYKNRLDAIAEVWIKAGLAEDSLFADASSVEAPVAAGSPEIQVPRRIFRMVARLVQDHADTREKPLEAATRLFEGLAPENQQLRDTLRPVILQWLQVTDWFMKKTHDSGAVDGDCDWEELRTQFELFELTLSTLVRGFFTAVEGLDEILEDTNS